MDQMGKNYISKTEALKASTLVFVQGRGHNGNSYTQKETRKMEMLLNVRC